MTKYIDRYYLNGEMYAIKYPEPNRRETQSWEWIDETYWLTDRWDWLGPVTNQTDAPAYIMKKIWDISAYSTLTINTKRYVSSYDMRWALQIMLMSMSAFDNTTQPFNRTRIDVWSIPLYQYSGYDWVGWTVWDANNQQTLGGGNSFSNQLSPFTWIAELNVVYHVAQYSMDIEIKAWWNTGTWSANLFWNATAESIFDNLDQDSNLAIILNCWRWFWEQSMNNRLISASYELWM